MKFIKKILDNYYSEQLLEAIKGKLIVHYGDFKVEKRDNTIVCLAKYHDFGNEYYTVYFYFKPEDAFLHLLNWENISEQLNIQIVGILNEQRKMKVSELKRKND